MNSIDMDKTYVAVMDYRFGKIHMYAFDGDLECDDVEERLTKIGFKESNISYMCCDSPIEVCIN